MRTPFAPLLRAVQDVSAGNSKIPQRSFLPEGELAIVDQGRSLIAGFTNNVEAAVKTPGPVVVFGDHTRAIKYVDFPFAMGADGVKVLLPREGFDAKYVYRFLQSQEIPAAGYSRHFKYLKEVAVPKPSLDEQRRIAAILDHADALRARRRQVLDQLDTLARSIFKDMFGAENGGGTELLNVFADVSSGITKGRRTSRPTRPIPYLSVSNVQAGHLSLDSVKKIEATEDEIARFSLRSGDLVITEGGDPDKLGRGTVWREELPACLHQNHIFRVRVRDQTQVLPDYLSSYLGSAQARSYFRRSAKQTTGIASINMTQLKALPVQVPSIDRQAAYLERSLLVTRQIGVMQRANALDDELFMSLQARAFRGDQ